MSAFSPSSFLLWSILACLFQAFLVFHLWYYDRFQCIKWSSGRQPGAFKRVMTYSYLATVPMLMVFSVVMAVLSYQEGWEPVPSIGILTPKPFTLYTHPHKKFLLPMCFLLACAWSLELVTHLEELTFWLFLLHQGPSKRDWFHSWEFRAWSMGSVVAILGMPIAVIVKRHNYDLCMGWILFSGSSAGTVTTIAFIYVLIRFPHFMRRVKAEGAEPDVVVRLATFYQLNVIRIVFRFLFNFSLLALALDGIQGPHTFARYNAASDLLSMLGGIGCFVSSAITLLIFFPRSITRESGYKAKLSSTPTVEDIDGATSPLPDYSRHARYASSPKSPGVTSDGHWTQGSQMNAFRFGNDSDYSLTSPNRIARGASYPSHRRYSSEGEATPTYSESEPETTITSPPRRWRYSRRGGDDGGAEMIWEMQRPAEMVAAYRQRHRSRPQSEGDGLPRWEQDDVLYKPDQRRDGKRNTNGSALVILPSDGPPITLEDGVVFPSPRSSFVHPYVMTFTSPIDLLDSTLTDSGNAPRAS
ncbi:hypothetical protein L218DRAFT_903711 [Marasmius fiardii PR-910]|nr:hypothetical protein L218DRAFT_903711 [Marasmius fiardii PR-910]